MDKQYEHWLPNPDECRKSGCPACRRFQPHPNAEQLTPPQPRSAVGRVVLVASRMV
jgi:hypothetical protein